MTELSKSSSDEDLTFPIYTDSSNIATLKECQQKHFYSAIMDLRRPEPNVDLIFGGAIAEALAAARRLRSGPAEEALLAGTREILRHWGDTPPEGKKNKTLWRCIEIFLDYIDKFDILEKGDPPYRIYQDMVEFSFSIPFPVQHPQTHEPILYSGRFDAVVEDQDTGAIWALDEKTTSQLGQQWSRKWDLRGQFIGYVYALREHDIPAQGVIVRGLCPLAEGNRFGEAAVTIDSYLIEQWKESTTYELVRGIQVFETYKENLFNLPKAFNDACTAYSGCPYSLLCKSGSPERWLQEYRREKWNPLD